MPACPPAHPTIARRPLFQWAKDDARRLQLEDKIKAEQSRLTRLRAYRRTSATGKTELDRKIRTALHRCLRAEIELAALESGTAPDRKNKDFRNACD